MTLVNYWILWRPKANETPGLDVTPEQPLTVVKEAVAGFLDYVALVDTNDRVGLSVYTSADGTAALEVGLTENFQLVKDITNARQAGHYHYSTNIHAGLQTARLELDQNGRPGAYKMVVLLTDGVPNVPANAAQAALDEAQLLAGGNVPVFTISLGALADVNLMAQIANLSGAEHFNIPGGQTVEQIGEQLQEFFRRIADHRPLHLVR